MDKAIDPSQTKEKLYNEISFEKRSGQNETAGEQEFVVDRIIQHIGTGPVTETF